MPTQLSARAFADKWRGVELKERSAAQALLYESDVLEEQELMTPWPV